MVRFFIDDLYQQREERTPDRKDGNRTGENVATRQRYNAPNGILGWKQDHEADTRPHVVHRNPYNKKALDRIGEGLWKCVRRG